MKMLIVGSLDPNTDAVDDVTPDAEAGETDSREDFEAACRELGAALARDGRTIVVGSATPGTADRYVLEGANSVEGSHPVVAIRPDDSQTLPTSDEFPNLSITSRRRGQSWTVSRAYQINEADVVIALGGGGGTLQAGLMAPALQTPTLAVRAFPGTARELWKTYRMDYERADLAPRDIGILEEPQWTEESAAVVARAASDLVRRNPYQVNRTLILLVLLIATLALMACWITLFLNPQILPFVESANSFSYATFILLGLSSFLGAAMRTTLPMLEGRSISLMQLISEMIVGIFLAFGFMLVYLATGILVIGQVNVDSEGFRNAAVTTSLMGFAVAFFAEQSANQLRKQLGERL